MTRRISRRPNRLTSAYTREPRAQVQHKRRLHKAATSRRRGPTDLRNNRPIDRRSTMILFLNCSATESYVITHLHRTHSAGSTEHSARTARSRLYSRTDLALSMTGFSRPTPLQRTLDGPQDNPFELATPATAGIDSGRYWFSCPRTSPVARPPRRTKST